MQIEAVCCGARADKRSGIDWARTAGLAVFGAWHYGGPAKFIYLWYDRVFGKALTLRTAAYKTAIDVYVHSPFLLLPSFYLITGAVKGQSLSKSVEQLRREWYQAAFGTALFWTPVCWGNFLYVPQHSRILVVSVFSFIHKTWMSWLSNRDRHEERQTALSSADQSQLSPQQVIPLQLEPNLRPQFFPSSPAL
mmetsp:Transcript_32355/g.78552  ORF Transcript_32355/g.78552 Transcript_32355/m.78552 type:complete len:193 (+) Transcript_32355:213-791(+)